MLNKLVYNFVLECVCEVSDECVFNIFVEDSEIVDCVCLFGFVVCLWDVCCLLDFCKVIIDVYVWLVKFIYMYFSDGNGWLFNSWMQVQFDCLDKIVGDVDVLVLWFIFVCIWVYVVYWVDWMEKLEYWCECVCLVEDCLLDVLYERLM